METKVNLRDVIDCILTKPTTDDIGQYRVDLVMAINQLAEDELGALFSALEQVATFKGEME